MWQDLKVNLLRRYYRVMNAWAWRRHRAADVLAEALEIPGPAAPIPARLYRPAGGVAERSLLYFHGGGWVLGDLETHRPFCEQLCRETRSAVIAVDYRRAPEHPFPAAVEDCLAATDWVLGGMAGRSAPAPLFVGGDSAGGNLAAVVARGRGDLAGQILIYPVTAHYRRGFPSYRQYARGHVLTRSLMVWFWDTYLAGCDVEAAAPQSMPLEWVSPSGLPPALVITAEFDPLKDEGVAFSCAPRGPMPSTGRPWAPSLDGFVARPERLSARRKWRIMTARATPASVHGGAAPAR
jgi:acetyl esterase